MTVTIWAPIADAIGACHWVEDVVVARDSYGPMIERRHRHAHRPHTEIRTAAAAVPVDLDHLGEPVGAVVYAEADERCLTVVAVVDLDPDTVAAAGPLKLSPSVARNTHSGDSELRSVAIVAGTEAAAVGLAPLAHIPGDIRSGALNKVGIGQQPAVLRRAVEHCRDRRWGAPLSIIRHLDHPGVVRLDGGLLLDAATGEPVPRDERAAGWQVDDDGRPIGVPIEHRPGGRIIAVR